MSDLKDKVKDICELKESLICEVRPYVNAGVFSSNVNGTGVGQVIDMIKDLADAEKNIYKACYYKKIVEAMEEEENRKELIEEMGMIEEHGRMGYDAWHYPSSGRFAPTGSGRKYGYPVRYKTDPSMRNSDGVTTQHNMNTGRYGYPMDERYGMAYNDYTDAKKYYHESQSPDARREMSDYANEHLDETMETTKEIWSDAKPEKKKEFKKHMMELLKTIPD